MRPYKVVTWGRAHIALPLGLESHLKKYQMVQVSLNGCAAF